MTRAPLGKREIVDHLRAHPEELEPGLVVLKHDLEVADGVPVDLLAADATGRPTLVFAGSDGSDALVLALLDGLGWAGATAAFFERMRDPRIDRESPPRAFVVVPDYPERLRRRLAALGGIDVTLVRVEVWREGGSPRVSCLREGRAGARAPVESLAPALRPLWDEAVAGLRRLDEEVEVTLFDHHCEARHLGRLLGVVGLRPDRLRALVPDEAEEDLHDRRALHRFLDAALRRLLAMTVDAAAPAAGGAAPAGILTEEELGELTR